MLAELLELAPERRRGGERPGRPGRHRRVRRLRSARRAAGRRAPSSRWPATRWSRWSPRRFRTTGTSAGSASTSPSWWRAACTCAHRGRRRPHRGGVEEVVIDPGGAFGTGTHPTTRMCLELLLEASSAQLPPADRAGARRCGDDRRACDLGTRFGCAGDRRGEARLRAGAGRSTPTRRRSTRRPATRARTGSTIELRRADLRARAGAGGRRRDRQPGPRPAADRRRAAGRSRASGPGIAIVSGLLREEADRGAAGARGAAACRSAAASRWGLGRTDVGRSLRRHCRRGRGLLDSAVTTFAVKFLGCKVSQADAMLARSRLLAAGSRGGRRRPRRSCTSSTPAASRARRRRSRASRRGARRGDRPAGCSRPAAPPT